jgi:hypothetical protein
MHAKINRTLATIALVLGIVLMAVVLYVSLAAYQKASALGDALGNLGGGNTTSEVVPAPEEPKIVQPGDPGYEPFCYTTEQGEEICE